MKITIIGTGYVGLVSGACLAELGNDVMCLDIDAEKIAGLKGGEMPIYEPGLAAVVERNIAAARLHFTNSVEDSVIHGQVQFIAVGTPASEDGSADLRYVLDAARGIGRHMQEYRLIVDKSTVSVGTAEKVHSVVSAELIQRGKDIDFSVVSNPEFLKEGAAIEDFMRPDRIVVGANDENAIRLMREIYAPVRALQQTARENGTELRILEAVDRVNRGQKMRLLEKITQRFGDRLAGRRFAVWGLAFKPDTDDMREAPSQILIPELIARGATVSAYDPIAVEQAKKAFSGLDGLDYAATPQTALDGADCLVIVTEWKEFRSPDFDDIRHRLKAPIIIDGRNLYDPALVRRHGIEYSGIGRP